MDKMFNPEKYGMLFCLECHGSGKILNEPEDIEVCSKCGGFGFIKKERGPGKKKIPDPSLTEGRKHHGLFETLTKVE